MSDTWSGSSSTDWFTTGNWSTGKAPAIKATGTVSVVINGSSTNQPVIPFNETEITVDQTVNSGNTKEYTSLTETQIGGEYITLNNGADLTLQGIAVGVFYGNAGLTGKNKTMTGLHGATTITPSYDHNMSIIATGTADTLTVETVNENFGLIDIGTGDTLTIYNTYGNDSNPQSFHGLINYGLITVNTGGDLVISAADSASSTVANFYNAGWIVVDGGTLSISSSILDGANTVAGAGTVDGYIEIGSGGDAILSNTVAASEEVTFTDTSANTLQITAGTLFSGTVNNFGPSDTIVVNGFTSTSNATITTVGGVTELITTNGNVLTTITLTGTTSNEIDTSYNSTTSQEVITGGGSDSYASGTHMLTGLNGTITNNSTITVTGATTDLVVTDPVVGTGAFFIDYSATLALDNTTGNDSTQTVIFGTHGSTTAPNTLLVNDGTAGFGGTITSFGSGDDIQFGGSTLPALTAGEGVVLNYNATSHVLTISETNASGTTIGTETLNITGTAALSTGSFIGLESTSGLNIELAAAAPTGYTFSTTGTGSFEAPADYTGGIAPGDTILSGETVTIAAGTASVSGAILTDNGAITVAGTGDGFTDAGSLSGTGTLGVATNGTATLTGTTSLASIADAGALTLGGTVSGPITIASGGAVAVTGTLVDTGSISGAGALTLGTGTAATLTGGISAPSLTDNGSLTIAGIVTSTVSGTGALTVAAGTSASLLGSTSGVSINDAGALTVMGAVASNITGTGTLAVATGTAATLSGTDSITTLADSGTLTVSGSLTDGNAINSGTGALTVSGTASLTGNTTLASLTETGTGKLTLAGADAAAISIASGGQATISGNFSDSAAITGTGSLTVNTGITATLASGSVASVADHGTLDLAGSFAGAINMEGNTANTVAEFNTANDSASLTNFGTTDKIILGTGALTQTGATGAVLSYSGSVLTVTETNAAGGSISSDTITVSGVSTLAANSFVALQGTGGVVIELASNLATSFIYDGNGLGSFEAPANYTGGIAPGDSIALGESVTIATGTASVSTSGVVDNGLITVASSAGFIDTGSLSGTGALAIAGSASLTGTTSLASITDTGTLTLSGADAAAVTIGSTGQVTVAAGFSDSAAITGTGSLTVNTGVTATLSSGSVASVTDLGTLDLTGSFGGGINMHGNGANTAVDFNTANDTASLTSFGTTDKITLSSGALTETNATGAVLSYNGSVLTVTETNASGGSISSDTVTVSGVSSLSSASFVALQSTSGVVVELASNLAGTSFTYDGTGLGSFEAPGNYAGGIAPGDSLASGESVTIATGTASVTTGGVVDNGSIAVDAGFIDKGSLTGTGTLNVAAGATATLGGSVALGAILDGGTIDLTGSAGVSAIDMQGNNANTVLELSGGAIPAITDFGTTDEIVATGVTIGAGDGLVLSYNSATGVLTGTETNSTGGVIGTDSATVTGVPGTTLSTSSFVALQGAGGLTIELAPATSSTFDFSASSTGSFEDYHNYTSLVAPGDVLSNNTTVAITAGTASVSTGGVTDNGLITISAGAGFIDTGALTGTGAVIVGRYSTATLTGNTSLATAMIDKGSLTMAGTDTVAIGLSVGGQLTLSGNFSDADGISGAGSLTVDSGVTATLASGSIASVSDAGTLDLTGSFGGSIDMQGANAVVDFTGAGNVSGNTLNTALTGFGSSDKIIVGTADFALDGPGDTLTESLSSSGVLTVTDIESLATLNIDLGLTSSSLASYITVSAATDELTVTLCFYPGTALATPDGEIKVEDIVDGDMLMTANGAKPVRWIGQSHIHTGFADPLRALPIRIRQGALGDGLPVRDLLLSPGHAIAIDDVLVHASALVNGVTIIREYDVPEHFTYYHVELETHELLIAEGVAAESFVDNVDRMHFHNWDGRVTPDTAIAEMDLPRARSARQVPTAIRNRLGLSRVAVA